MLASAPCCGKLVWGSWYTVLLTLLHDALPWASQRCEKVWRRRVARPGESELREVFFCFFNRAKEDFSTLVEKQNLVKVLEII